MSELKVPILRRRPKSKLTASLYKFSSINFKSSWETVSMETMSLLQVGHLFYLLNNFLFKN